MMPEKLRRALPFLGRKVLLYLAFSMAIGLGLSLVELLFAYAIQALLVSLKALTSTMAGIPDWIPSSNVGQVVLFVLAIGVLRTVLQWLQITLRGFCQDETRQLMRRRIVHWSFQNEAVSSSKVIPLFSEFVNGTAVVVMSLQTIAVRATTAVLVLGAMFHLSLGTTGWVLLALLAIALPMRVLNQKVYKLSQGLKKDWELTSGYLLRSIRNLILIRIYGTQRLEETKALASLARTSTSLRRFNVLSGLIYSIPQLAGMALICLIVYRADSTPEFKAGSLMTYLYLLIRFSQTLSELATQTSYLMVNIPSFMALFHWWKDTEEYGKKFNGAGEPEQTEAFQVSGAIGWEVKNLHFAYDGHPAVLADQSFTVQPGSIFLIQGPSGSGKSTLLGILLGIVKNKEGLVNVFTKEGARADVLKAKRSVLRHVGYVGPEPFLIEGTIRENLLYGLFEAPAEVELQAALSQAQCDFVSQSKMGLEHRLNEQGAGLSAGQKQRISLARALLRKPAALIIDEGTANLDSTTERKIIDTLLGFKHKTTMIVVSHRDTFAPFADHILVLTNPPEAT